MASGQEIQALLRFLAQDAKVPLPVAIGKVKPLQDAQLSSPEKISKTSVTVIQAIFEDEKQAKAVLSAAKRSTKKRGADAPASSPSKRTKVDSKTEASPAAIEASLQLPTTEVDIDELSTTTLHTNRAPLVLAFAVTLLKYTEPSQPLSSRLSLAQALVSVNSRSKAVSIGIVEKGTGAEEEGWGAGQPGVKIMGRDVKVMKRHGYDSTEGSESAETAQVIPDDSPALWGLDLEALRSSNSPVVTAQSNSGTGLPIYSAQGARAYLLRSFASNTIQPTSPSKKKAVSAAQAEKEENLGRLLKSLDLLYGSWSNVLDRNELDRRAWSWYVAVRPDVRDGAAGWGGKGEVSLRELLDLRRSVDK